MLRAGSMRATVPARSLATQTALPLTATLAGPLPAPSGISPVGLPVWPSNLDTVPSPVLVTQSAPAPQAMPLGLRPAGIGLTTAPRPLPGRTCVTVPDDWLVAHTDPPPQASWVGLSSSRTFVRLWRTGSNRMMLLS
jgi:hypothetical protein